MLWHRAAWDTAQGAQWHHPYTGGHHLAEWAEAGRRAAVRVGKKAELDSRPILTIAGGCSLCYLLGVQSAPLMLSALCRG